MTVGTYNFNRGAQTFEELKVSLQCLHYELFHAAEVAQQKGHIEESMAYYGCAYDINKILKGTVVATAEEIQGVAVVRRKRR